MSFRRKLILGYCAVFVIFFLITFPYVIYIVSKIVHQDLIERSHQIVRRLETAQSTEALLQTLQKEQSKNFFRIALLTDSAYVLYDSHLKSIETNPTRQSLLRNHPEVVAASREGVGSSEEYSTLLQEKLFYVAERFEFQGNFYILRIAFKSDEITRLARRLQVGFITCFLVGLGIILFLTAWMVHYFLKPIREMISVITPYHLGKTKELPYIYGHYVQSKDEVGTLAQTINHLSDRVQLQFHQLISEKKEKLAILEGLIEGVVAFNNKLSLIYFNPAAKILLSRIYSFKEEADFDITYFKEVKEVVLECQKKEKSISKQISFQGTQGKFYYTLTAIPCNPMEGWLVVIHDNTAELRVIEMKKDFIANASHELKTPITIIRGFAETLQDHSTLPKATQEEMFSKILKNCDRMTYLIKSLLVLSNAEQTSVLKSPIDLILLLQEAKQTISLAYSKVKIDVPEGNQQYIVYGDWDLLLLTITNLMENAVRYCDKPLCHIQFVVKEEQNDFVLKIIDNGMGIPPGDLPHIFERFYTVDKAHSRRSGGSGLGLSIVKTILQQHQATISVSSVIREGTTFEISFPKK